jgi:hypothetical protein
LKPELSAQCEPFSYISWELQITRLICACLFHFLFQEEIESALKLMKFVTLHKNRFRFPLFALLFAFLQLVSVSFIEVIQIINLVQLNTMKDIVMNFVSLLILAQFDDYFLEIFLRSKIKIFIEKDLVIENFRQHKLQVSF